MGVWPFSKAEQVIEKLSSDADFWGYNFKEWEGSSQAEGILI